MSYNFYNNNNNNYQQNQSNQQNQQNQQNMSEYYGDPATFNPQTRLQDLNQRYLTRLDTGNNSTRSLGGVTAIGTPRVNPTENADEVDSIDSSYYSQQGVYNREPKYSLDDDESRSGSMLTKRDSHGPLIGQNTHNLGNQYHPDYNQSSGYVGFYSQQNNYHRQEDPYYDEEATRHNTLTSGDPNTFTFEHDYTDRDFPGGGKGARQSMTGEHLIMPTIKKKRRCCGCCTWPICILITIAILVALGVTAFFVLPRIPTVDIKDPVPASAPILSTNPPLINMNVTMLVEINNENNYVPYKFNRIDVSVFDRTVNNSNPVATGTQLDYTLQPKRIDTIQFPITVNYTGQSLDDPVIKNFINACSPQVKKHVPLKLRVEVVLSVWGIDWIYKPTISEPIPDMKCPDI